MSKKFLSGINVTGTATLNTVANAGLDTDKFLVLDAAGNVDFRTGDELKADIGADVVSRIEHEVKLGETMTIGTPVYIGVDLNAGTNMTVYKATNATEAGSSKTLGLIASSGITNDLVEVVTEGLLAGLNTSTATKGDPVWLGVNGALIFGLANKPVAPAHMVFLGIVTRVQSNNGEIFVKVQNGFEMNEIHNYLEGSVQNNEVIVYESATSLYKPKSIPAILGYTPVPNSRTITINGTSYDLSENRAWTITTDASARSILRYVATAGQTTFTISGGYTPGLTDVYRNGVKLDNETDFTATNGTTIVLTNGAAVNDVIEVYRYQTAFLANNALRVVTEFVATAGQTTFNVTYNTGLVDVFYNGSKLVSSEYTAGNGTTIVLNFPCNVNDSVAVHAYSYQVGAFSGQAQLNGTGFVKANGTTITYDNSTYLTTSAAASGYIPYTGANANIVLGNYNLSLTDLAVNTIYANNNGQNDIGSSTGNKFRNIYANSFVKTGGTSSQFLKADGSIDSTTYAPSNFYVIDYLVVAGGGGGGGAEMSNGYGGGGAGGGAGGYLASTTGINVGSSYTVIVGAGGAGGASRLAADGSGLPGSNGGYSQLFHTVCLGGGQGQGDETNNGNAIASTGGSGGGNGGDNSALPGSGTTGQGNSGGSRGTTRSGGGGGGANTPGGTSVDGSRGGLGGNGLSWFDTNIYSCGGGGGGGGAVVDNAAGGNSSINGGRGSRSTGGGGTTGEAGGQATPGTSNTGTGGGGAGAGYLQGGQNGGSGIVIIRYAGAQRGTGGTVTSSGGYTYHRFTSSGIFTA